MNVSRFEGLTLSREARLGSLVAVLIALGAICFDLGWHAAGIILFVIAAVVVAAYVAFIVRPARIPKDAVLTLRIADGIREDAPRSPLEQLRSRGLPTLYHVRLALEAAATDAAVHGDRGDCVARDRTSDGAGDSRPLAGGGRGRQTRRRGVERRQRDRARLFPRMRRGRDSRQSGQRDDDARRRGGRLVPQECAQKPEGRGTDAAVEGVQRRGRDVHARRDVAGTAREPRGDNRGLEDGARRTNSGCARDRGCAGG